MIKLIRKAVEYVISRSLLAGCLAIILLVVLTALGARKAYLYSSSPEFCNTCHVMEQQYESWFMTGLHRSIKCVDCHLPNTGFARHIIWKGIDGTKDFLQFHTGLYSDVTHASDHTKKVIMENCVRCHDGMVSRISYDGRNCWDCHRRVNHKNMTMTFRND